MECVTTVGLIFLLFTFPFVSGNKISCTSPRDVVEGDSVSIVCHYFTNIELDKMGFYVYRYPPDSNDPEVAAICNWTEDTLHCEVLPGYEVNVDGYTVTLNVTSVRTDHAGRYSCRILTPGEDVQLETCHLNVHVEILRCSKEDACIVNVDGYKVRRKNNPQEGYRILVALVEKRGQYVCTTQGTVTQSCTMEIIKDPEKATVEGKSLEVLSAAYALGGVGGLIILITLIFMLIRLYKRRKRKETTETHKNKNEASNKLIRSEDKGQSQTDGSSEIVHQETTD